MDKRNKVGLPKQVMEMCTIHAELTLFLQAAWYESPALAAGKIICLVANMLRVIDQR